MDDKYKTQRAEGYIPSPSINSPDKPCIVQLMPLSISPNPPTGYLLEIYEQGKDSNGQPSPRVKGRSRIKVIIPDAEEALKLTQAILGTVES